MVRTEAPRRLPIAAIVPGLCVLALACYWPALHGGLVWDDAAHVTKPELQSWTGLWRIWTDLRATQQFYPVLHSAFWLEHRLWGDATLGYHLVNVALHVLAAGLLAQVVRRGWPAGPEAGERVGWIAAAIFTVHPVMVESVAWISEQKNTLSLVWYLSAALAYGNFEAGRGRRWYAAATGFFLLALGTKTVTATLPAALFVVQWWRAGELKMKRDVAPLLPWFAAAVAAGSFTAWVERTLIGAQGAAFELSLVERGLLAGRVVWFYLGKLVWPAELMFIYPRWDVRAEAGGWWPWLAAALAVTAALWALRRRARGPLAAWLFFGGSLFPALGFFNVYPFLFSYVADHFQYLASIGVIVTAASAAAWGWERATSGGVRMGLAAGAGMALVLLVMLSRGLSADYRDGETLYRATLAKNPACWMAHSNLATELAATPARREEALGHFREAIRLKPDSAEAHNNFGNALVTLGREAEAIAEFEAALRIAPDFIEVRLNLANALAKEPARREEAMALYADAARRRPDYAETPHSLATTLSELGRREEAERAYREALRLRPDHGPAEAGLASLLSEWEGRREEAGEHFARAVALLPRDAKVRYNHALWLENTTGRLDEAAAEYEAALRIDPGHARAHNNLGILFARRKAFAKAREHWEAAVRAEASYEDPRRNLRRLDELERK